jgi:sugar phosphate permease
MLFVATATHFVARTSIAFILPELGADFRLTPIEEGYLLAMFFAGYIVFNLVGGFAADKFGARLTLGVSFFCAAAATAATAAVQSRAALFALQALIGAASGPIWPTCAKVVTERFPIAERGRATAMFDVGSYVGLAVAGPLVVGSMFLVGWRGALLICAALVFLWPLAWFRLYPTYGGERQPSASAARGAIESGTPSIYLRLLIERKVWGMAYGASAYNYVKVFYVSWLPTFLLTDKGLTVGTMAAATVLLPVSALVGEFAAGFATDKLLQLGENLTWARKIPLCLGFVLSAVIAFAGFTDSTVWTLTWLAVGYAAIIGASPGIWTIPADVIPATAIGQLGGLQNAFANIGSLLSPIITAYLWSAYGSFRPGLVVSAIVAVTGALSYLIVVGRLERIHLVRA